MVFLGGAAVIAAWCVLAWLTLAAGSTVHDRHPRARWAQLAHVAGGAWFTGVWLAFFLLR